MGETNDHRARAAKSLSAVVFLGAPAGAGATRQIVEKSAGGSNTDFTTGTGGENHRGRAAGPLPGADAQNHLVAGAERGVRSLYRYPGEARLSLKWIKWVKWEL